VPRLFFAVVIFFPVLRVPTDCAAKVAETERLVVPVSDSPKPPPERITLTLPVINAAMEVIFVALGPGKAEIVQRVLEVGPTTKP
jgi:6-phosphogluconolactonase/glucosamine-6-phosphate isomerase/deaminase